MLYCDRRSVGQFILVPGPMTITFFLLCVRLPNPYLPWTGWSSPKSKSHQWGKCMGSMHCNMEFRYQLSICSGTKENHGKLWVAQSQDLLNANWLIAKGQALNPRALMDLAENTIHSSIAVSMTYLLPSNGHCTVTHSAFTQQRLLYCSFLVAIAQHQVCMSYYEHSSLKKRGTSYKTKTSSSNDSD
jgi:hypothetical protein